MLMGMGSLSYGELAGERMKLGLMLHDPEEEHDCFSDNTHDSHYYNEIGIANVYFGSYRRSNGDIIKGFSLAELVNSFDKNLAESIETSVRNAIAALAMLKARVDTTEAYDQMLGDENKAGNLMIQTSVNALVEQAHAFEKIATLLELKGVNFEGSDSLDKPEDVFN